MDLRRRAVLASVGTSFAVAGCLGDGDDTGDTDTDTGDTDSGDTDTDADSDSTGDDMDDGDSGTMDPVVTVRDHADYGDILVGPDGMTLYMFDSDEQGGGASTCTGGCADSWPPLTVESEEAALAGDDVEAELTTFERDDDTLQVAANGWPLYYFDPDDAPGDVKGQGVNDVWWVLDAGGTRIRPDPVVTVRDHADHGEILVGPDGMTLYMFDSDDQGSDESTCTDTCADNWPPLTVDGVARAGEGVSADVSTFERDDGTLQVAANGWPLYYFVNDEMIGDTNGQGVNDVWWVLDADGTPIRETTDDSDSGTDDSTDSDTDGDSDGDSDDDSDGGYY